MGIQDRFFARWLLPIYPLLCLLAAWAAVEAAARVRPPVGCGRVAAAGALLCAQGLVFSIHNDLVLARDRHAGAGARVDGRPHPGGRRRW